MRAYEEIFLGTWAQFLNFAVAEKDERGEEQGACALCWRIVGQVVFVEGGGVGEFFFKLGIVVSVGGGIDIGCNVWHFCGFA